MAEVNRDPKMTSQEILNDSMDKGPISDHLNSDNAFNDRGLENNRILDKAMKKGKSE